MLLMGDFNAICSSEEKLGGKGYAVNVERSEFREFITSKALIREQIYLV